MDEDFFFFLFLSSYFTAFASSLSIALVTASLDGRGLEQFIARKIAEEKEKRTKIIDLM